MKNLYRAAFLCRVHPPVSTILWALCDFLWVDLIESLYLRSPDLIFLYQERWCNLLLPLKDPGALVYLFLSAVFSGWWGGWSKSNTADWVKLKQKIWRYRSRDNRERDNPSFFELSEGDRDASFFIRFYCSYLWAHLISFSLLKSASRRFRIRPLSLSSHRDEKCSRGRGTPLDPAPEKRSQRDRGRNSLWLTGRWKKQGWKPEIPPPHNGMTFFFFFCLIVYIHRTQQWHSRFLPETPLTSCHGGDDVHAWGVRAGVCVQDAAMVRKTKTYKCVIITLKWQKDNWGGTRQQVT